MHIAVFSDSHDRMDYIDQALRQVRGRGITNGIHLGDFCAPRALEILATSGISWKCVWGNIDGDRLKAWRLVSGYGTIDIVDEDFREIQVEHRSLFLTHYPEIARLAALSGRFDAVFHGHNHIANQEVVHNSQGPINECLLANPGELCGFRYGEPTFGIYDTESNTFEHVKVKALLV